MKVFEECCGSKQGNSFILILDKREAKTLVEIVEAAVKSNKRKSTFRTWSKKLEETLACF